MSKKERFKKRWFENSITNNPFIAYGDTDSEYFRTIINGINKWKEYDKFMDICNDIGSTINKTYNDELENFMKIANVDTNYNNMKFDHEVTSYLSVFISKKHYGMYPNQKNGHRIYKFDLVDKFKIMGAFHIKADASFIVKEMFNEIYQVLLIKNDLNMKQMKFKIFQSIRNKCVNKVKEGVEKFELDKICQIKKFPTNAESDTFTKHGIGMKWFNTFVNDQIRRGDACYMLDVRFDLGKLEHLVKKINKEKPQDLLFGFTNKAFLPNKLSQIAIPVDFEDYDKLKKVMNEQNIIINQDQLILFHVDMKLDIYRKLFE